MTTPLHILYEDKDILVVDKPAGMAVQHGDISAMDLESAVKNYLAAGKGRAPYLALIHRLDRPVQGVILMALNKKSAAGLSRRLPEMEKVYLAVTEGRMPEDKGSLTGWLKKDGRRACLCSPEDPGAKKARLFYRVVTQQEGRQLVAVRLETGRFHQIRAQLSGVGCPIYGDVLYGGSPSPKRGSIALCACRLSFAHPVTERIMSFDVMPADPGFEAFAEALERIDLTV